eukprot:3476543-Prymnesium_polylepis.1
MRSGRFRNGGVRSHERTHSDFRSASEFRSGPPPDAPVGPRCRCETERSAGWAPPPGPGLSGVCRAIGTAMLYGHTSSFV